MSRFVMFAAILASFAATAGAAGPAQAPFQGPVQGPVQAPSKSAVQAPVYSQVTYAKVAVTTLPICNDRCIDYRHLHPRTESCGPRHETTLLVKDQCCCCLVPVPVCLPDCCVGTPEVCCKGKHVVEYTWSSGYMVRVIVKRNERVIVQYNA